jgi:hypothetical protein
MRRLNQENEVQAPAVELLQDEMPARKRPNPRLPHHPSATGTDAGGTSLTVRPLCQYDAPGRIKQ